MAVGLQNSIQWENQLSVTLEFFNNDPQRTQTADQGEPPRPYWLRVKDMQDNDNFLEGMLLKTLQKGAKFPYIQYVVYNNSETLPDSASGATSGSTRKSNFNSFNGMASYHVPVEDRDFDKNIFSQGIYKEMFTFVDHQTPLLPKRPQSAFTGYVISAFKATGPMKELDKNWSYWSGADLIVETIPPALNLQRLTFHKRIQDDVNKDGFVYVMFCELGEALSQTSKALEFVDTLNYRQCGVSSLYCIDHFF